LKEEFDQELYKKLIKKYNVLACPKYGIPRLTSSGNFSRTRLRIRKMKHSKTNVVKT